MRSLKAFTPNRGFTLIELLTVFGMLTALTGLFLFMNVNSYLGADFRAERNELVTVFQTARSEALNNRDQKPHGVIIGPIDHPQSYISFEGQNYSSSDPASRIQMDMRYPGEIISSLPIEIIFSQLSGDALDASGNKYDGDITMFDSRRNLNFIISINHEGRISW